MRFIKASIHNKLVVLMILAIIIPMTTSTILSYVQTKESLIAEKVEENTKLLEQGNINISNYINKLDYASLTVYSDANLYSLISRGLMSDTYGSRAYINTLLSLFQFDQNIDQVFLSVDKLGEAFFLNDILSYTRGKLNYSYPLPINDSDYRPFIEAPHLSHSYGMNAFRSRSSEHVLTLHRPIYIIPTTEIVGWLAIDVTLDSLKEISSQLYTKDKEEFYILDSTGELIFSSDDHSPPSWELRKRWSEYLLNGKNSSRVVNVNDPEFSGIVFSSILQTNLQDFILIKRVPNAVLLESANILTQMNLLITVLSLILVVSFVWIVSANITSPIKQLTEHMNKIEAGFLNEPIHINREDEVGKLGRMFQNMMDTINNLIIRQYKQELINTTTQLKMLQAQINPHFMNNSLQSIGSVALDNGDHKVYSLTSSLGKMMHYSMNMKDIIVNLVEEIDYVKNYLKLQQQRFEDNLMIELEIADDTLHLQVPKMILQPIVENYFEHGYNGALKDNSLKITSFITNNNLMITIQDNGTGMTEDRLQQLRDDMSDALKNSEERREHIGLLNVLRRLQLYFGNDANMELETSQPHGLKVKLIIPIKKD